MSQDTASTSDRFAGCTPAQKEKTLLSEYRSKLETYRAKIAILANQINKLDDALYKMVASADADITYLDAITQVNTVIQAEANPQEFVKEVHAYVEQRFIYRVETSFPYTLQPTPKA